MGIAPAARLRLEGTHEKQCRYYHKDEPQNYKGNSSGTDEYGKDSHRDYLRLSLESTSRLFESRPPVKLTPGSLASSGGAKVPFMRGLQTPN